MGKMGKVDFRQCKELRKQIKELQKDLDNFYTEFLGTTILKALAMTQLKTPFITGTLRRDWKVTSVKKVGNYYEVALFNNTEYVVYVEYGHRLVRGDEQIGFVNGKFMMTLTMKEIERELPGELNRDFQKWLNKKVGK